MDVPSELLTIGDLGTLAGLSVAVYVIVSALRGAGIVFPVKAVALGIGLVLSVVVVLLSGSPTQADIVMAIVNGCLAALVATGGSSVIATMLARQGGGVYRMANAEPVWWEAW